MLLVKVIVSHCVSTFFINTYSRIPRYYYDNDTGLYYLNARYYSPEWRRFISPDDTAYLAPDSVNGLNLYCYCNNDPVNYADPSGHSAVLTATLMLMGIGIATGLGYAAYTDYTDDNTINGSIGWQSYVGYSLLGGAIGAGIGLGIGYTFPYLASFLGSSFTLTLLAPRVVNMGGVLVAVGGTTISISGAQVAMAAGLAALLGVLTFARTEKSGGYYGEGWPGDPHKPEHIHLRGNGADIRIGRDGNPLPNEPSLSSQQRKALKRLWKQFVKMFNSWHP